MWVLSWSPFLQPHPMLPGAVRGLSQSICCLWGWCSRSWHAASYAVLEGGGLLCRLEPVGIRTVPCRLGLPLHSEAWRLAALPPSFHSHSLIPPWKRGSLPSKGLNISCWFGAGTGCLHCLSPTQACGNCGVQPLLEPAAAPRGVGMSSAAGNVLCWCRGRARRAHCGVVLAVMPWAASCCGRPSTRSAAGHVRGGSCGWGPGLQVWGNPPLWCLLYPGCQVLSHCSRGKPGFWGQCGAGTLPRQAGEGLAGCRQSSTHGNLLLYKGWTFRGFLFFPCPKRLLDNGLSWVSVLQSCSCEWGPAWQRAAGSEIAPVNRSSHCSVFHPCSLLIPSQQRAARAEPSWCLQTVFTARIGWALTPACSPSWTEEQRVYLLISEPGIWHLRQQKPECVQTESIKDFDHKPPAVWLFSPPTFTIPYFEILDFSFQRPWVISVSLRGAGLAAVAAVLLAWTCFVFFLSLLDVRHEWSLDT